MFLFEREMTDIMCCFSISDKPTKALSGRREAELSFEARESAPDDLKVDGIRENMKVQKIAFSINSEYLLCLLILFSTNLATLPVMDS